jgi:transcriptional regulator NrdR family protein
MITPPDRPPNSQYCVFECPHCHGTGGSDVVDSRATKAFVRRRRICRCCQERFTTYEQAIEPTVVEQHRDRAKAMAAQLRSMAATLEAW